MSNEDKQLLGPLSMYFLKSDSIPAQGNKTSEVKDLGGKSRIHYRIWHWLFGGHTNKGNPVRDVEHCDLCNEHSEPMEVDEGV